MTNKEESQSRVKQALVKPYVKVPVYHHVSVVGRLSRNPALSRR